MSLKNKDYCHEQLKNLYHDLNQKKLPNGLSDEQKWILIEKKVS